MKEKIDCGCEGSCPICRLGEVDNHKCNNCETEFCPVCHGTLKELPRWLPRNVIECECEENPYLLSGNELKRTENARKKY